MSGHVFLPDGSRYRSAKDKAAAKEMVDRVNGLVESNRKLLFLCAVLVRQAGGIVKVEAATLDELALRKDQIEILTAQDQTTGEVEIKLK